MTDLKPLRRLSKTPLYVCGVIVLITLCLIVWKVSTAKPLYSNIDPFSGPLVVEAPGCEITGPDGKSLVAVLANKETLMIPAGTKFNGDCFPVAKAAIEQGKSQ